MNKEACYVFWFSAYLRLDAGFLRLFGDEKSPHLGGSGPPCLKEENFPEYCRQNGQFFLKAGLVMALIGALDALVTLDGVLYVLLYVFGLAFAFYPLMSWCRTNEGFSWPWPHVESEKARIKRLRKEQEEQQDNSRQG